MKQSSLLKFVSKRRRVQPQEEDNFKVLEEPSFSSSNELNSSASVHSPVTPSPAALHSSPASTSPTRQYTGTYSVFN